MEATTAPLEKARVEDGQRARQAQALTQQSYLPAIVANLQNRTSQASGTTVTSNWVQETTIQPQGPWDIITEDGDFVVPQMAYTLSTDVQDTNPNSITLGPGAVISLPDGQELTVEDLMALKQLLLEIQRSKDQPVVIEDDRSSLL